MSKKLQKSNKYVFLGILVLVTYTLRAQSDKYWSGNGPNDDFGQSGNWFNGNPSSGDNLYFNNTQGTHNAYSNYGSGSYFNNIITYNGAGGIKIYGDNLYANKYENFEDPLLLELSPSSSSSGNREIGNRIGNDFEINPVGTGGILISCDKVSIDNLNGTRSLKIYGQNRLTINASIYEKNGTGSTLQIFQSPAVILNGENLYTGLTTINGGTLRLNHIGGNTLPSSNDITIQSSGVLRISENQTLNTINLNSGVITIDAGVVLTVNNLIVNEGQISDDGKLRILESLSINGGTLTTNNNLTLVSTAANTAQVTEVLGSITGDVTVERYIPSKRAWRALTAPLKGSNGSLYTTWQNGGTTLSDTGLEIWGPTGTNIVTGPNYSVLDYTPTGWVGVTNTSTSNLFETTKNNAYLVFVTGAYGTNNITNGLSAATTLKATGTLITGDVNYTSIIDTRHTLIGNPYASPLEPSLLVDGATDLISSFWVWDPSLATTGGYVSYDDILNTYSNNTGSYPTNTTAIQSGQAFFVKATTGNTGSLTLSENKKATSVSNVFGKTENTTLENSVNASIFRVGLLKVSNQDLKSLDGAVVGFYDTANDAVDNSDGKKFANGGENIAFVRNNIALSSEHYSPAQPQDELFIRIWNTSVNSYVLRINTEAFDTTNLEATLIDLFTGTQTPIALDGTVQEYAFAVTSSANSTGDRFKVVFGSTALGTTTLESSEVKVYPNPVTTGVLHIQLPQGDYTNYSYELINVLGQKVQSNEVESQVGNQFTISTKGLSSNWYILRLLSNGQSVYETKVIITN